MNIDVIVAGSGPSGVSAAFPLVKAGLKVLMIDAGKDSIQPIPKGNYFENRYLNTNQWKYIIGENYESLENYIFDNPKQRVPRNSYVFSGFNEINSIYSKNFTPIGSLAKGGLSNIWGGTVACFDSLDFKNTSMKDIDLTENYKHLFKRIGVSGVNDDDLSEYFGNNYSLQPHPPLDVILDKVLINYEKNRLFVNNLGIKIGRSRNAILTQDLHNRKACKFCSMCMYGCSLHSIYNSKYDLQDLQKCKNFEYRGGLILKKIHNNKHHNELILESISNKEIIKLKSKKVVLACGTLATSKIILESLNLYELDIPFISNPRTYFALIFPKYIGKKFNNKSYSFGQAAFTLQSNSNLKLNNNIIDAFGVFYNIAGIPLTEFAREMFTLNLNSRKLLKYLMPAIRVANCYLPGYHSNHKLKLQKDNSLMIEGNINEDHILTFNNIKNKVSKVFKRYGGFILPGSFKSGIPGSDVHYAGTNSHSYNPKIYQTKLNGEVFGLPNTFVVDASVLPFLSTKPHTLTIMANADRIAKHLIKEWNN